RDARAARPDPRHRRRGHRGVLQHAPARPGRTPLPPRRHPAPGPARRARHAGRTARPPRAFRHAGGRVLPDRRTRGRGAGRTAAGAVARAAATGGRRMTLRPPGTHAVLALLARSSLLRVLRAARLLRARSQRPGGRGATARKGSGAMVVLLLVMLPLMALQSLLVSNQTVRDLALAPDAAHAEHAGTG